MSKPYKCPVCEGGGRLIGGLGRAYNEPYPCPACHATGIVWSPSDEPDEEEKEGE